MRFVGSGRYCFSWATATVVVSGWGRDFSERLDVVGQPPEQIRCVWAFYDDRRTCRRHMLRLFGKGRWSGPIGRIAAVGLAQNRGAERVVPSRRPARHDKSMFVEHTIEEG